MKNCKLNPYIIALPFEGSCDRIRFIGFVPVIPEDVVFFLLLADRSNTMPDVYFLPGLGLACHCLSHGDDR